MQKGKRTDSIEEKKKIEVCGCKMCKGEIKEIEGGVMCDATYTFLQDWTIESVGQFH